MSRRTGVVLAACVAVAGLMLLFILMRYARAGAEFHIRQEKTNGGATPKP